MKIETQLVCEELGGQPACKLSFKRGEPLCKIIVPVMHNDTHREREAKVARAVHDAMKLVSTHKR